jgi:hypothetical protein
VKVFWGVDIDIGDDPALDGMWQPFCFEEDGTVIISLEIWFNTEAEALSWVTDNMVNVTHELAGC